MMGERYRIDSVWAIAIVALFIVSNNIAHCFQGTIFDRTPGSLAEHSKATAFKDLFTIRAVTHRHSSDWKTSTTRTETPIHPEITASLVKPVEASHASPHWHQFVPKLWDNPRGIDIRISWVCPSLQQSESTKIAYSFLDTIEETRRLPIIGRRTLEKELAEWMRCFERYCGNYLVPFNDNGMVLSARLVCNRGAASTKCPKWHQDYVPFRWIQALVGPGCEWVEPFASDATTRFVERSNANYDAVKRTRGTQQDDHELNSLNCQVHRAETGQAIILLGKKWNSKARENSELEPVIHKSPDGIRPWQGRVLLTMDVEEEDANA